MKEIEIKSIGLDEFIKTVAVRYGRTPAWVEGVCKDEILNKDGAVFFMGTSERYRVSQEEIVRYFDEKAGRKNITERDEKAMDAFMKIPAVAPETPVPAPVPEPKKK